MVSDRSGRVATERRGLVFALLASAVLHALVLLLPLSPAGDAEQARAEARPSRFAARPLLLIAGEEQVDAPRPPIDGTQSPVEAPERPPVGPENAPPTTSVDTERAPADPAAPPETTAPPRRIVIPLMDPRLWQPDPSLSPAGAELRRSVDRVLLGRHIVAYYDSVESARAELPRGMSRWTTERDGGRAWGVSPGRLSLGSVTVPFCGGGGLLAADCGFGMLPNHRASFSKWASTFSELRRQAHDAELVQILEERIRAIRARTDAARATSRR